MRPRKYSPRKYCDETSMLRDLAAMQSFNEDISFVVHYTTHLNPITIGRYYRIIPFRNAVTFNPVSGYINVVACITDSVDREILSRLENTIVYEIRSDCNVREAYSTYDFNR